MGAKKYEVVSPCPCTALSDRIRRYNVAGIPGAHAQSDFDNYTNNAGIPLLEMAKAFVHQEWPPRRGFLLSGPTGTGKTHLAAAILRSLIIEKNLRKARYVEMPSLFQSIRHTLSAQGNSDGLVMPLVDAEFLVMDELGRGRGSPFEEQQLDYIISRRYNETRLTVFLTNYTIDGTPAAGESGLVNPQREHQAQEELPQQEQRGYVTSSSLKQLGLKRESLESRIGARLFSRICEMCDLYEMPPRKTNDLRLVPNSGAWRPTPPRTK